MSEDKDDLATLKIDRSTAARPSWMRRIGLPALALITLGLFVLLALRACGGSTKVEVARVRVSSGSAPTVLNASGYVTPRRRATVAAKITGRVAEMLVEEGLIVKAGQVLARLDDAEWKAQSDVARAERDVAVRSVAESEASLLEAKSTLRRNRELIGTGLVTDQDLERADTSVKVWQARLDLAREQVKASERRIEQAERNLDNCTVRAPFDGVAISKDAQVGEIVSPMSAGGGFTRTGISTIVDMTSLEIEVDVNEANIARVQPGQPVLATLDAYPDWQIPSKVRTTIPAADRQKATVKVRITFDQLDPRILPDMGVKVAFLQEADTRNTAPVRVTLMPKDAVRDENGTSVVFVVKDGRLERRAVKLAGVVGNEAQVVAGLSDGEKIVAKNTPDLKDGLRVSE
ncbi:MAG: efflux RND transporter periplasmic adaptor subunit [Vicinamibacteria bacterium]|nr:efflux RND transporter periplasmic adaptor subunit [Vicinamibacteria bacterium]